MQRKQSMFAVRRDLSELGRLRIARL